MKELNLTPSLLAAQLATKYLSTGGLVFFTGGAAAYKELQPYIIGYSLAKSGVKYIATALAQRAEQ